MEVFDEIKLGLEQAIEYEKCKMEDKELFDISDNLKLLFDKSKDKDVLIRLQNMVKYIQEYLEKGESKWEK